MVYLLKMVMFNSYVSLPEGMVCYGVVSLSCPAMSMTCSGKLACECFSATMMPPCRLRLHVAGVSFPQILVASCCISLHLVASCCILACDWPCQSLIPCVLNFVEIAGGLLVWLLLQRSDLLSISGPPASTFDSRHVEVVQKNFLTLISQPWENMGKMKDGQDLRRTCWDLIQVWSWGPANAEVNAMGGAIT